MNVRLSKVNPGRVLLQHGNHQVRASKSIIKFRPLANISQLSNGWHIDIALPGYDKENINIDIMDRNLRISNAANQNNEESTTDVISRISLFERSFHLPKNANEKEIKASLLNGILHLFIPVQEEKITKINIQ